MKKDMSREQLLNALKDFRDGKIKEAPMIRKQYVSETKAEGDGTSRTVKVVISTSNPDRSKDVVHPGGMKLDNYLKNPVVMPFHNYKTTPIGNGKDIQPVGDEKVTATVDFLPEGVSKDADLFCYLYKNGHMSAWSIGFIPLKWNELDTGGIEFLEWELLEFSAVPVPDNAEALTMLRSKGFEVADEAIEKVEEVKDAPEKKDEIDLTVDVKDVSEVVALSYILADLKWLIKAFVDSGVDTNVTEKMKSALALLMEGLSMEAELGKKEFTVRTPEEAPSVKLLKSMRDELRVQDKGVGLLLRNLNAYLNDRDSSGKVVIT